MKKINLLVIFGIIMMLAGCAAPNVPLSPQFWHNHKQKVVVATAKMPTPTLYQQGQEGLLDVLINDISTQKFHKFLAHYPLKSVLTLQPTFATQIRSRHITAHVYQQPIDISRLSSYSGDDKKFAAQNFIPLVALVGPHKLLIVSVNKVGAVRKYYSFIPLDAPKAICYLEGRLVDLTNNRILWRDMSNVEILVQGSWDQPPNYPNFSDALYKAITTAQQELLDSFFSA